MPHKETDTNCHNKKKHIGNDYVTIVYNESEKDYDLYTVKVRIVGVFLFCQRPVDILTYGVSVLVPHRAVSI